MCYRVCVQVGCIRTWYGFSRMPFYICNCWLTSLHTFGQSFFTHLVSNDCPNVCELVMISTIIIITCMPFDSGSANVFEAKMTRVSMMTSFNGNIFRVTGPLCEEFTGFDVFFDLCLIKDWVNNREAGDLRRHRGYYDVNVMRQISWVLFSKHVGNFLYHV